MVSGTWKRDFASGLIVLLPILVSLYVLIYIYGVLAAPFAAVITSDTLAGLGLPSGDLYVNFVRALTTLAIFVLMVFSIGYLMRTAFGDLVERTLDDGETYTVDTGHIVAFEEQTTFSVNRVGGLKSTLFSGEGLVCEFTGPGRVWLQTRSFDHFLSFLIPQLPSTNGGN
jgi:hypothetical protein